MYRYENPGMLPDFAQNAWEDKENDVVRAVCQIAEDFARTIV